MSQHKHETLFHKRAAGEAMEQIKTFRSVGGGRWEGRRFGEERGIPDDGIRTDTTTGTERGPPWRWRGGHG